MAGDMSVHNNNNTTSSNNINRGEERGLTPEARAGAVQSPRKHNRTGEEGCWGRLRGRRRAEERRKNGVGGPSAGVRSPPHRRVPATHPSMVQAELGEEKRAARRRCFGPRVHSHRSQAATMENNELTSGFVTSHEGKHGGVPGGHASDRVERERESK